MESRIVYFDKMGEENTDAVFQIARRRAEELGVKTVLVASTRGNTAVRAIEILQGLRVIAVSHSAGFLVPGTQSFTNENRQKFESNGGIILTATHIFAGVSRAARKQLNTIAIGDMVAMTLRTLGEGMKVVCEISMMAADAGLVRTDEDIISIAGTGRGADTAVVLKPVYSQNFFEMRVREILCKPRF